MRFPGSQQALSNGVFGFGQIIPIIVENVILISYYLKFKYLMYYCYLQLHKTLPLQKPILILLEVQV